MPKNQISHCVKRIRIRSYSGRHFFRIFPHLDWIRRDTPVRMRENLGKMQTRITPNTDSFYAVSVTESFFKQNSKCFWITSLQYYICVVWVCYILRRLLFKLKFCNCNGHVGYVCAETCTIYNQLLLFLVDVLKFIYKRKWRETRPR